MMKEHQESDIDREALDFIALGNLLQEKRPPYLQDEINRIVKNHQLSPGEKIKAIQEVDTREKKSGAAGGLSPRFSKSEKSLTQRQEERSKKNQLRWTLIKNIIERGSFWNYLFRDIKKINDFGQHSHLLHCRLIPPRVDFTPDLGDKAGTSFQNTAAQISSLIRPLLSIGWLYLRKREFNQLALVEKLCREITKGPIRPEGNYQMMEVYFFVLLIENPLNDINQSLDKIHRGNPRLMKHPLQCQQLIKTLLTPQPLLPSLPHFIRALNMVKYRRYLEMEDLFQKTGDNLIDTRFYDCPAPVSEKISKFVHESAQKIQQLHQH